jgi:hypothetical protein
MTSLKIAQRFNAGLRSAFHDFPSVKTLGYFQQAAAEYVGGIEFFRLGWP